jgi:hypothetical protein
MITAALIFFYFFTKQRTRKRFATSRAAESLHLDIAPGMIADLIAVDGDPIKEITALRKIKFVMRNGIVSEFFERSCMRTIVVITTTVVV